MGGVGFISSSLAEELLKSGHFVFAYDDLSSGYENNLPVHESLAVVRK